MCGEHNRGGSEDDGRIDLPVPNEEVPEEGQLGGIDGEDAPMCRSEEPLAPSVLEEKANSRE